MIFLSALLYQCFNSFSWKKKKKKKKIEEEETRKEEERKKFSPLSKIVSGFLLLFILYLNLGDSISSCSCLVTWLLTAGSHLLLFFANFLSSVGRNISYVVVIFFRPLSSLFCCLGKGRTHVRMKGPYFHFYLETRTTLANICFTRLKGLWSLIRLKGLWILKGSPHVYIMGLSLWRDFVTVLNKLYLRLR